MIVVLRAFDKRRVPRRDEPHRAPAMLTGAEIHILPCIRHERMDLDPPHLPELAPALAVSG